MLPSIMAPPRPGAPLVPAPELVLQTSVPGHLWRVRLAGGGAGWWKRDVTPRWRLPCALHPHSRAQREFAALRLLRERNLPAPEPLDWRERRAGGLLLESALLTREAPDVVRLDHFLRDEPSPERRAAALNAAGALAAEVHAHGFVHFRLLPKNLHLERSRPDRAWILDAPYACAWRSAAPWFFRRHDLCALAGPGAGLGAADAAALIEAYERRGGRLAGEWRLLCAGQLAMKAQRIMLYLGAVWTGHRPELFL